MATPGYCPYCDSRATSGGSYCPSCGRDLGGSGTPRAPHHPHQEPAAESVTSEGWWGRRSTIEKAFFVVGLAVLIVVVLLGLGAL